ncbi:MAG TPA: hypothetical protein VFA18_08895, partial [Gemmataceae bacterium]|nr:hypothetical protein [Gemmataceae bacterium]
MPSNQPNRDWRQGQASPAKAGAPRWRRAEKAGPRRPLSKKAKRVAAVGSLMGLVVLLAIVIKLLQPVRPAFLAVSGAAFDTNLGLPTDVYGYRTMRELLDVGSDTEDSGWWAKLWHTGALKVANKEPAKLSEEWLQGKDWWDAPEKTVLLYLGTHGGVDKTGAFLFYEGENGQIQRLYIQKLLDRFQEEGPNRKNIVLLLDATQVDACWSQGLLYNDFARRLKSEVDDRKLPNLIVLCASGPDQRSWVSEEWQESIFGHY